MIPLLLDQGVPFGVVQRLRAQGWDVVHVSQMGLQQASDEAILEAATAQSRSIVTLDSDFHSILARRAAGSPSVVRIRQEGLGAELAADRIAAVCQAAYDDLQAGAAVTATRKSIRIRRLPLI